MRAADPRVPDPRVSARRTDRRVPFALALAVASISFAAIFFRLASGTHPLVVAGTRLAIAATILAIPSVRAWRAGRLPPRVLRAAVACGALYAVHFGAWVSSLELTSVASSVTLVTATPLLLGIAATAGGRDAPQARHWLSIALATLGLALIGLADLSLSPSALSGDALALLGAAAMAGYLWIVRRLGEDLDVLAFGGVATAAGAIGLLGAALAIGEPIAYASSQSFLWIMMAALVPQLVGHTLLTWSLRHTTPTVVGIATVGEPVGSTLLAWLWLHESPSPLVLGGCAITLAAVVLSLQR